MAIRSLTRNLDRRQFQGNATRAICASASRSISMSTCTAAGSMFKGRISGFTMGTGSTLALLPAENATGNFVKVVQRLPVRIELRTTTRTRTRLFIGSVGHALCLYQRAADRSRCRQSSCKPYLSLASPAGQRRYPDDTAIDAPSPAAVPRGGNPVAGGRRRRRADLHGGARHDDRQCGAALHRRRPVGDGR